MFGTNPMNFDFFQHLWLLNFVPNHVKDAKSKTAGTFRSSKDIKYGKEDKSKSLGLWFGIWENFLPRRQIEVAVIPRAETVWEKFWPQCEIKLGTSPNAETLWEKLWPRSHIEVVDSRRVEHKNSFKKLENKRIHQEGFAVWNLSWGANRFEPASILKPERNGSSVKTEIGKPPLNMTQHDKLGVRERFWSMNLIETIKILRSERNKRIHQEGFDVWYLSWGANRFEPASILKPERNESSVKTEIGKPPLNMTQYDKLGVRERFWSMNLIETINILRSERNNSNGRVENRQQLDKSPWEIFRHVNQTRKNILGPKNKSKNGILDKSKPQKDRSLQDRFGVRDLFWQINQTEISSLHKTYSNTRKTGNSKPLKDRFSHDKLGVWELFWRMYRTEESRLPKLQKNSFKGKTEIGKPSQDRSLQEMFGAWKLNWKRNEIDTASIQQAEKNKPYQDMFRIWQHIQQSLPWNQSKNKETDEFEILESGCVIPKFTPYMAKIPWHTGPRAFLSQIFPRYGNYCGPNWSSGKNQGALLWDKKPIDLLDYCCFCHDIGYDTHDQAELLKADLAFLECLLKTQMVKNGNFRLAEAYRSMCITGLKTVLIPYRQQLLKQMHAQRILASKITRLNWRKSAMQPQ